jgi:hypothetical protein
VSVVRWLSDEPQPGWVEARFTDASGRQWRIEDKPPIFSDRTMRADDLPAAGSVGCSVKSVHLDAKLRLVAVIRVNLAQATDGSSEFQVLADQLAGEPSQDENQKLNRYRWLAEIDRDTLQVAIKVARDHDPTLDDEGVEPVFADDVPGVIESATGSLRSGGRLAWLRLRHRLPTDRGRVAGKPFWFRRDLRRWAEELPAG